MNNRFKSFSKTAIAVMLSVCLVLSDSAAMHVVAEETDDTLTISENTEPGDYVILAEHGEEKEAEAIAEAKEIAGGAQTSVYEADLTKQQIKQLEQENIQVEENFFLFGADTKKKSQRNKTKNKKQEEYEEKQKQNEIKRQLAEEYFGDEDELGTEWNYQMIKSDETEKAVSGNVKVAILDSGVDLLAGIPFSGSVNLVDEEQDLPYYMTDMNGHGTAVADIIYQINPKTQLYAVKVLDMDNRGRLSDIVEGIYWCIDHDIDIINMSFGTDKESKILQTAIADASSHGIMIVGSAGNGGSSSDVEYPAAFEEVIAVGAVDTSAQKTQESATGPEVELVAPGEQIKTKSMFGLTTINSGTSMAAPHVTGAAALLMAQAEEKDAQEIRDVLNASGNPLGDREEYGNGLVDVEYAQELLEEDAIPFAQTEKTMQEAATSVSGNSVSENSVTESSTTETTDAEENYREVETFEDVDYVEGRWEDDIHKDMIQDAAVKHGGFSAQEIKLLRVGAMYPDKAESGMKGSTGYPEWHGYYIQNYMANYIFATKIAQKGGDTSGLSKVTGQSSECYNRMKNAISTTGINGLTWHDIIKTYTGYDYNAQSSSTKKKWRQLILYGMAMHTATDVFAHNCYYKDASTGEMIRLDHSSNNWADEPGKYPNRFKCAERITYYIIIEYEKKWAGDIFDFSSYGCSYWNGFYLRDLMYYAFKTDSGHRTSAIQTQFKAVNYKTRAYEIKEPGSLTEEQQATLDAKETKRVYKKTEADAKGY